MFVISGVTGHVGSAAAHKLLDEKQSIRVIVRSSEKGASFAARGAEVAVGDLGDVAFLAGALKGASAFFVLLPPNYGVADFYAFQRKLGSEIAAAVKASGVPYVVLLSSVGADRATDNGPIKGLHHLENELRATGVKLASIRAGSFQENVHNILGAAKGAGIYPSFGPANYSMHQIATKDIGHLAAELLLHPPAASEIVDLLGPAYTGNEIAAKLGTALGKTLQVVEIPPEGFLGALTQTGMPTALAEIMVEMYQGFGRGLLTPKGDRLVHGKTELDETLRTLLQ